MTAPLDVRVTRSHDVVACHDHLDLLVSAPRSPGNPFTDDELDAVVTAPGGANVTVRGFCDSDDGSLHRVRVMPLAPGDHRYRVTFTRGGVTTPIDGTFAARAASRKGLLRVDPDHPFHFVGPAPASTTSGTAPPPTSSFAGRMNVTSGRSSTAWRASR